jgi:type II secretory pathway component PulF
MAKLKHRVAFYNTLATLEEAGVPPLRALQQRLPGDFQRGAQDLLAGVKQGLTVSQAMGRNPGLFSALEVSLVEVGEATGRRDTVYKALRDWFQLVWRLRARVIAAVLYPAFVYHAAAVLIPFITIFTEGVPIAKAAVKALCLLAAPWVALVAVRVLAPQVGALPGVGAVLLALPVLGGILFRLDCTRFFTSLSLCLRAGLGSAAATTISAATCRNPALRERFAAVGRTMATEACPFTDALSRSPLPLDRDGMIMELMQTGETSGKLEEAAQHIAGVCREEAEARMTQAAILAPNIAYLCLAAYIGYKIISFYGKLYAPAQELLQ